MKKNTKIQMDLHDSVNITNIQRQREIILIFQTNCFSTTWKPKKHVNEDT